MSHCKIYLENYDEVCYYTGSEVKGRIVCYLDEKTTVRSIKVFLKCKEYTGPPNTSTEEAKREGKIYVTIRHDLIIQEQKLFTGEFCSEELDRGEYIYPFSFILLDNDPPSTFKGEYGFIAYKLKGVIDRPLNTDYTDKKEIVVRSPIDFNSSKFSPKLQDSIVYCNERNVCLFSCRSGTISVDILLPKLTYTPGEIINLKVMVSNWSNLNITSFQVEFYKKIEFRVKSGKNVHIRKKYEEIALFQEHGVGAHNEHTYNFPISIPHNLEVQNFSGCRFFSISYPLKLSCIIDGCTMDLITKIKDIILGHIKLNE